MITDLEGIDSDPFAGKVFDVCIYGAGAAGITLALKLSKKLKVALLEAGDFEYSEQSQSVYQGKITGHEYFPLTATRLRYFGGTTNHWGGICRPLDSYDFEKKPYVDYSGWPIKRSELEPYLEETKSILDIPLEAKENNTHTDEVMSKRIVSEGDFRNIDFWQSAPTRFGTKYREEIEKRDNLSCFLNANMTNMTLSDGLSSVKEVEVRNYHLRAFRLRSKLVVLATGGIENPRILLNCTDQIETGIGNGRDLVGRFFADHPHNSLGDFLLEDPVMDDVAKNWIGTRESRRFLSPSPDFMQKEKILNFGLRFQPNNVYTKHGFKEALRRNVLCESDLAKAVIKNLRGESLYCPVGDGDLRMASEQAPNPSSRVMLGEERDKFGHRRTVLNWQLSEIDKRTIRIGVMHFAKTFAALSLGRVHLADWLLSENDDFELPGLNKDEVAGNHEMGTTRMATSPSEGVVDKNHKVFGIDNLYMAGSSVFSTTGHANPTFTIVQMTLRLADHINRQFLGRAVG